MTDDEQIEAWLDSWEELISGLPDSSLDEFIALHCVNSNVDVISRFRRQVQMLAIADRHIHDVGITHTGFEGSATNRGPDLERDLRPGMEPMPGYRLESKLGRGGFGEVWRATGPGGFQVALKFVCVGGRIGETEQRALSVIKDVRHPHLLSVFGTWIVDEYLIIATELADRTLSDRFKEAVKQGHDGIPSGELLGYMAEAAEAIDFLNNPHQPGKPQIAHRDIKPQNLLLSGRHVKVGDFGLARTLQYDVAGHTRSGTPAYAAPECLDGTTSNRSDQYSLAVTYFYLRTGKHPFDGRAEQAPKNAPIQEPNLSLLPPAEQVVVARALQKKSKDRWGSCQDFMAALVNAANQPSSTSPAGWKARLRESIVQSTSRRRIAIAVVTVFMITAMGLATRPYWRKHEASSASADLVEGGPLDQVDRQTGIPSSEKNAPDHRVTLTVTDFENHAKDSQFDGFRLGLRDMLVTDLAQLRSVRIAERARLGEVLAEHKLAQGDFIDPATANPTGKGVATQVLLTGGFLIDGDDVRVDLRLVSVATGAILLADSVTGRKAEFAQVQKSLTEKVVAGLKLPISDAERTKLGQTTSRDFEAFQLYGAARLAVQAQQQEEAGALIRQALARDPQFGLAQRELESIAGDALVRLTDAARDRLAKAGSVGQALKAHRERQEVIVSRRDRTPAYFTALIVLSAHAGLVGDVAGERQLLMRFWQDFASSVPATDAIPTGYEINRLVAMEGKFFQEQLDKGVYTLPLNENALENSYLKTELVGTLYWPKFSVIWPFDSDARQAFRIVIEQPGLEIGNDYFENCLPRYPHDYLKAILADGKGSNSSDSLSTALAVVRYYAVATNLPSDAVSRLTQIQKVVLERVATAEWINYPKHLQDEVSTVLELLGTTAVDADIRLQANRLALRLSQTVIPSKLPQQGVSVPKSSGFKVDFCSLSLQGPRVLFLIDFGRESHLIILPYLQRQLTESIGLLPPDTVFDVLLSGLVSKGTSLSPFVGPQAATPETRQAASVFVKQLRPNLVSTDDVHPRSLADALKSALAAWPKGEVGRGEICVICLGSRPSIPAELAAMVEQADHPRVLFVGSKKVPAIAALVRQSGGAAVVLDEGEFLIVSPTKWDLTEVP